MTDSRPPATGAWTLAESPPATVATWRRSVGLRIALAVVLLAIAGLIVATLIASDESRAVNGAPGAAGRGDAKTYVGQDGWQMSTSPDWDAYRVTNMRSEIFWGTGGSSSFRNGVSVLIERTDSDLDIQQYVAANLETLRTFPNLQILSVDVLAGGTRARLEYTTTTSGIDLHGLIYTTPVPKGWAVATFMASADSFEAEVRSVEPYLATLQAS